jgi:hypothetical protein
LMGINTSDNREISQFVFESIMLESEVSNAEILECFSSGDQICQIDNDGDGEADLVVENSYYGSIPDIDNLPPNLLTDMPFLLFTSEIQQITIALLEYINDEIPDNLSFDLEYDENTFNASITNDILMVNILQAFEDVSLIELTVNDEDYSINIPIYTQYDAGSSVVDKIVPFMTTLNNFPNPFNPVTSVNYSIVEPGEVNISVFNIKGQKITTLVNEYKELGNHSVIWQGVDSNGDAASSGIYFYKLNVNGESKQIRKCILMK